MTEIDRESGADSTSVFAGGLLGPDVTDVGGSGVGDVGDAALTGLEALTAGAALLVVKRGPNAGSRFQLDKDLVSAGRHPESDIFLDDVSVSRRHAEFRRTVAGFDVVDVGSLNGTYVNREPIESTALANGDEIQVGKFRLVFLTGGRPDGTAGS